MNIIMSAHNCEPDRGSEFETGWQMMQKLSKQCTKLTVVTRPGKNTLDKFKKLNIENTVFVFFDLPPWFEFLKRNAIGMQVVPYIWEIALFVFLLKKYSKNEFDRAYRTTVGSYRFPSLLWYFAPYFYWGPIASGETVPLRFLSILSWKGRTLELARMVLQRAFLVDPLILFALFKANEISVATTATKNILPKFAQKKSYVDLDFFQIDLSDFDKIDVDKIKNSDEKLKLLYVGKLVEWKGLMFVFRALRDFPKDRPYELNIIGDGPDRHFLQSYSNKYNLNVSFLGKKSRNELSHYYLNHTLFVSTDIHGRGSNTIVEAKNYHLPVLMLDITDPDGLTGKELNIIVSTQNKSISEIIQSVRKSLLDFVNKSERQTVTI